MRKSVSLLLILMLVLCSAAFVFPVFSQPTSSPSIPELSAPTFSAKYIPSSYTETITDPFTGQVTTQQKSNSTIEVTIENQQMYTPVFDANTNSTTALFYNVQVKGHFDNEGNWMFTLTPGYSTPQSDSSCTIVILSGENYPAGGLIDLRVRAVIGRYWSPPDAPEPAYIMNALDPIYQTSDWSSIQTLTLETTTIENQTPVPSLTPLNQTSQPYQSASKTESISVPDWLQIVWLPIVAIVAVVVIVAIIFLHERNPKE